MTLSQVALIAGLGGLASGVVGMSIGLGGGLVLIAVLSMFLEPHAIVVLTAPVGLLSTVLRVWVLRDAVDLQVTARFLAGAVPTAVVGSFMLASVPQRGIQLGLGLYLLASSLADMRGWTRGFEGKMPLSGFVGVGAAAGILGALVGGTGPLIAPFVIARGLFKDGFVATMAALAVGLNLSRAIGYGATGLMPASLLIVTGAAMVGVVIGNPLGHRILQRASARNLRLGIQAIVLVAGAHLVMRAVV